MADETETPKPPSRIKRRLIESAVAIEDADADAITYMHSVFCQTSLPYRNPGAGVRDWYRRQGDIMLAVSAGKAGNPRTGEWIELGLPFGPKPRLILAHLNREALIHRTPEIEVGDSLTAFVRRLFGYDPNGQEIRKFKDQLSSLAAATIWLAAAHGLEESLTATTRIVSAFSLWFPKDERQRVFWPSTVRLSPEYFESLLRHGVPLDERAIKALAHSAMGLDIYCWLAQRLYRVDQFRPQFIPWAALQVQFGLGYGRMNNFKRDFREVLATVHSQYRAARVELDDRGMTLRYSPPPVKGRTGIVRSRRQAVDKPGNG